MLSGVELLTLTISLLLAYPIITQLYLVKHSQNLIVPRKCDENVNNKVVVCVPARREPLELIIDSLNTSLKLIENDYVKFIVYILDEYELEKLKNIFNKPLNKIHVIVRNYSEGLKAKALNFALSRFINFNSSDSDYLLVLDIDSKIDVENLVEIIKNFSEFDVIIPSWKPKNVKSYLALGQAVIYNFLFDRVFQGLFNLTKWFHVLGSGSLIKLRVLKYFNGWPLSILEDVDLGIKLLSTKFKVLYQPQLKVYLEVPENYRSFVIQQCRWAYGSFNAFLRNFKLILRHSHKLLITLYVLQYSSSILILTLTLLLVLMAFLHIDLSILSILILTIFYTPLITKYVFHLYEEFRLSFPNLRLIHFLKSIGTLSYVYLLATPKLSLSIIKALLNVPYGWRITPKGLSLRYGKLSELIIEFMFTAIIIVGLVEALLSKLIFVSLLLFVLSIGCVRALYNIFLNKL